MTCCKPYHNFIDSISGFLYPNSKSAITELHCKNIWVTSTIFWLSQLHARCVCDTLQISRVATNLILNQSVVEKLLLLLN